MGKRFGVAVLVGLVSSGCYGDPEPVNLTTKDNGRDVSLALHQDGDSNPCASRGMAGDSAGCRDLVWPSSPRLSPGPRVKVSLGWASSRA